jgi:hypothetical protein
MGRVDITSPTRTKNKMILCKRRPNYKTSVTHLFNVFAKQHYFNISPSIMMMMIMSFMCRLRLLKS